jgi:hypothetical protein
MYDSYSGNAKTNASYSLQLKLSVAEVNPLLVFQVVLLTIDNFLKTMRSKKVETKQIQQEGEICLAKAEVASLNEGMYEFQINGLIPSLKKHRLIVNSIVSHFAEIADFQKDVNQDFMVIKGIFNSEQLCQVELILEELAEQLDDSDYDITTG